MRLNRKGLAAILRAITLTVFVADIFLGGYLLSIRVIPRTLAALAIVSIVFLILLVMVIRLLRSI